MRHGSPAGWVDGLQRGQYRRTPRSSGEGEAKTSSTCSSASSALGGLIAISLHSSRVERRNCVRHTTPTTVSYQRVRTIRSANGEVDERHGTGYEACAHGITPKQLLRMRVFNYTRGRRGGRTHLDQLEEPKPHIAAFLLHPSHQLQLRATRAAAGRRRVALWPRRPRPTHRSPHGQVPWIHKMTGLGAAWDLGLK